MLAALCALFIAGCVTSAPRTLVVGSDIENRPFAFMDENGRPAGRDVEMMQAIAEQLGATLEWRRMPFPELLDGVARGDVDVVCATMGHTPERARRVAFSRPYFSTRISVLARRGVREPRTTEDLRGRPVYAGRGTTSERAVRSRLPGSQGIFEIEGDVSPLELLRRRRIDAAVMDGPVAERLAVENDDVVVLDAPLDEEHYCLVFALQSDSLRERIDEILSALDDEGRLREWNREHGLRAAER